MKKLLFFTVLLLLVYTQVFSFMLMTNNSKVESGGAACDTAEYTNTTGDPDANLDIKDIAGTTMVGGDYTTTGAIDVCAVTFYISRKDADITANTYHVEIWTESGGNLGTQQGSDSNGIQGDNSWGTTGPTAEALKFEFASSVSLSATTTYWFLVTHNQSPNSATECELWYYQPGSNNRASVDGDTTGSAIADTAGGPKMIIWTD